ncbi:MAG: NAD(P)/FAD-dependent oxidoreductase [Planctomycetes bacterium]|nr:NAD(P)/FAD-dependent oxidoreductase [Planctomycetota bacterium]
MSEDNSKKHVVVIGGGFTGLAAAYELERRGIRVTVFEETKDIGGIAGSFMVGGTPLERFYHHFFTIDSDLIGIIKELGLSDKITCHSTSTGIYLSNKFFSLSTPLDILRFKPLSVINRFRLGLMVLKARSYKNWQELDDLTAEEWMKSLSGEEVFKIVWQPLLAGKFGKYASEVSAAWLWGKIVIRGGSRNKTGGEQLLYFKGGFSTIAEHIEKFIKRSLSTIYCNNSVKGIEVQNGRVTAVICTDKTVKCDAVIATPALPIISNIMSPHVDKQFVDELLRIKYLANICLVLELDRSLSHMYWINVGDPSFPFVGIIEHTNLESSSFYSGVSIVYLSKYLSPESEMYCLSDKALLKFVLPHIQCMFPEFKESWIKKYHVWRTEYAQPVVVKGFRRLVPKKETPVSGFYISTMAQIYPEDRGVNYAIRDGRNIAKYVDGSFGNEQ